MSTKTKEEYNTPSCQTFFFELSGNVMSPNPIFGINLWEYDDEEEI